MFEIGRLCVKIAGRDSGKKALIIDVLDNNYVLIDGEVRRKKCNVRHLEPLDKVLKINKNASHEEVIDALKKEGIIVKEKISKQKEDNSNLDNNLEKENKKDKKESKETKKVNKKK